MLQGLRSPAGPFLLLLLVAIVSPARAGVPDPSRSGCGFPAALGSAPCDQPVYIDVTLRDAFDAPVSGCSTSVTIVVDSGSLQPGQQMSATGFTGAGGDVQLAFPNGIANHPNSAAHLHFEVVSHCLGNIPVASSQVYYLCGCFSPTAAEEPSPAAGPDLGLAVLGNPIGPAGAAELRLALPSPGRARLEILDVRGRTVAVLLERDLPAGVQRVVWRGLDAGGTRVPAGVYFARLTAGGQTRIEKISLLR